MDRKKLNNLKFYIAERNRLSQEIDILTSKLDYGDKSLKYDNFSQKTNKVTDTTFLLANHNIKIEKILKKRINDLTVIITELYSIINDIEDPELKSIVELRAIHGLTWEEIGDELHCDRRGASRKYNKFVR